MNVFEASIQRIDYILDNFPKFYVSFSAGKDSSVLLQLVIERARIKNRLPVSVLLIDLEAQYSDTIDHALEIMSMPEIKPYWICLPLSLRNAVSCFEPKWKCWDQDKKDIWVRNYPDFPIIKDNNFFDWFDESMEFEEFIIKFAEWYSEKEKTACFVGIRTQESLNRWRTIFAMDDKKEKYNNFNWTTLVKSVNTNVVYNVYPIFDWQTTDIWHCVYHKQFLYNKIYDKMYLSGRTIHDQRICQPYGDDQRKGLDLFHLCEPESWFKVVNRVAGANFGSIYKGQRILGNQEVYLPTGHTYKSFTLFLLSTMPAFLREHYAKKIHRFFWWWKEKEGWEYIPDSADKKLESSKKCPSWRRVCKALLKNDFYMKSLSFSQNVKEHEKFLNLKEKYADL